MFKKINHRLKPDESKLMPVGYSETRVDLREPSEGDVRCLGDEGACSYERDPANPVETKVALIGAYGRYNYGDVLMPVVWSERLKAEGDFRPLYYTYLKSDLSDIGGFASRSFSDYHKEAETIDWTLVTGGHVVGAEHRDAILAEERGLPAILRTAESLSIRAAGKVSKDFANGISRSLAGDGSVFPWMRAEMPERTIYNTVGGSLDALKRGDGRMYHLACELLSKSPYVSVRSKTDWEPIAEVVPGARLVPDSMITISTCYPMDVLRDKCTRRVHDLIEELGDYFVFQVSGPEGSGHEPLFAEQIRLVCKNLGLTCLLLPIGYAHAHDDLIPLRRIRSKINTNVELLDQSNIFDVTYALANARCFVGTSLHGCVVSCSYGVPHTTLLTKRPKTACYLSTWESTPLSGIGLDAIEEAVRTLLRDSSVRKAVDSSKSCSALVEESWREIIALMRGHRLGGK